MALSGCQQDQGFHQRSDFLDQKHGLLQLLLVIRQSDGGLVLVQYLLSGPVLSLLVCNIAEIITINH